MGNPGLQKLAAAAIKYLQQEVLEKTAQLKKLEGAEKLAFRMYSEGVILAEQLPEKIKELREKSETEIKIIQKGIEFSKNAGMSDNFTISKKAGSLNTGDPSEQFWGNLLDD